MESINERASNHLHFLGDALHAQSVRHFFFVDLESVGGVVHPELYRLLYGRVSAAHEPPAAILLFRRSHHHRGNNNNNTKATMKEKKPKAEMNKEKEKEKQKTATKRFEERCGNCKKAITTNIYFDTNNSNHRNHNSGETPTAADQRRIWVHAAASPAHMISFAAAFLVERALALPGGDNVNDPNANAAPAAVNVYLVSNDDAATKQLARQLKARVRLAQAVADIGRETAKEERSDDDDDDDGGEAERVRFHRLRVDRAGVWAKPRSIECLREAGLLAHARVAADSDGVEKKAPPGWEVVNPFAFFALQPKDVAERRATTATTEVEGRWKEKDIDAVVRRAKYHLWAEHERGIVLPRTLHDLRKKVRQLCVLEKRLDPRAVLALLERSRLIDVCPICHDFDYSFDRYNAARSESKKKRAKPTTTGTTGKNEGGETKTKSESESDAARAQRKKKKESAMDRHSKEERIKRVAKAVTLKLLKAKREVRPKGRQALLDHIDAGHAAYKTRLDAELVLARLTVCGFVSTPNRATGAESRQSGAAAALGREDISVEYDLGALGDDERQWSADEAAAQQARKAAAEAEAEASLMADGRSERNAGEQEEEEVVPYAPAWTWADGDEAASEDQLTAQRRLIGLAAGRRTGKGDKGGAEQGGGVGTYMAYLAEQLRVPGRSADSIGDIDSCGLSDEVLRGFYSYGFEKPTVLQRKGIANIMAKRDTILLGCSGSGKTAAYVVPLLQSLERHLYSPQAIVLAPTRPLAQQIEKVISSLGEYVGVQCALVCGGGSVSQCIQALTRCHVVVATAGRLYDMIKRKALELNHVQLFVIDEIDDMLSTTKKDQLYDIVKEMPSTVQVVTVDTVLSEEAFSTHLRFMRDPMAIATDSSHGAGVFPPGVDQYTVEVEAEEHKLATLLDLLGGSPAETRSDTLQPRSEARGRGNWDEARWSEAGDATAAVVVESPRSEPDAGDGGVSATRSRPPPPPPREIEGMAQMVIFCNSKRKVDWLTDRMLASNFPVLAIHEDMDPTSVQTGLSSFRAGSHRVLITTDSLSFGLDVHQLNLVVNYDVPKSAPGMVRRVGRAGRFMRKGAAITLLAGPDDRRLLEALQAAIPFHAPPLPASLVLP